VVIVYWFVCLFVFFLYHLAMNNLAQKGHKQTAYTLQQTTAVFTADELLSTAALQPINFVTPTRLTNNASCNWVNLVQVSSVQFSSVRLL